MPTLYVGSAAAGTPYLVGDQMRGKGVAMVARVALLRSFSMAVGSALCGMWSRGQIGKVPFGSGATPSSSTLALE